jgi:hypothetical protein
MSSIGESYVQFRKATWSVVAGAAAVLALTTTPSANRAGAAPAPGKPAAPAGPAPTQQSGAARAVHSSHPTAPSAAELANGRPVARPAAAFATPQRGNGRYGPISVPAGQDYQIWSYCPGGMVATGGGESNTSVGGITLHSSEALADGSGWFVDVSNGTSGTIGVTVYSVCFSGLTSYKLETHPTFGAYQSGFLGNAGCSVGTAVGVGGVAGAYDQYLDYMQTADDQSWIGFAGSVAGPAPTLQVICAGGFNRLQDYGWSGPNIAPGQDTSVGGDCPAGTVLVSGGGGKSDGITTRIRLTDSYPTSQGWNVYAHNDSILTDSPDAFVLCGS